MNNAPEVPVMPDQVEEEVSDALSGIAPERLNFAWKLISEEPTIVTAIERFSARGAMVEQRRSPNVGDIHAETHSDAQMLLVEHFAKYGVPTLETGAMDNDTLASLIRSMCYKAAAKQANASRQQWSPKIRQNRPSEAENVIENWTDVKVIFRAERYITGLLAPRCTDCVEPVETVELRPNGKTGMMDKVKVLGNPVPSGKTGLPDAKGVRRNCPTCHGSTIVPTPHRKFETDGMDNEARKLYIAINRQWARNGWNKRNWACSCSLCSARAILDARVDYAWGVPNYIKVPGKAGGGTVPSAEGIYWRNVHNWTLSTFLDNTLGADTVDALEKWYRGERRRKTRRGGAVGDILRRRFIGWKSLAEENGVDQGQIRYMIEKAAKQVRLDVRNWSPSCAIQVEFPRELSNQDILDLRLLQDEGRKKYKVDNADFSIHYDNELLETLEKALEEAVERIDQMSAIHQDRVNSLVRGPNGQFLRQGYMLDNTTFGDMRAAIKAYDSARNSVNGYLKWVSPTK